MGITVVLETENGEGLETLEDPTNVLHRVLPAHDDPTFAYLGCIDLYGDTVINYLQASRFLAEWTRLRERTHSPAEQDLCDMIQKLAERLGVERHLYLKFYGD